MSTDQLDINFFNEDISFELSDPATTSQWILKVIDKHNFTLNELNFIFCSDAYLHQINLEYLDHDTFTDIITFDNAEEEGAIEGDIFISIDRIKENAVGFETSFEKELFRVMIHGVLHLLGFNDKTGEEKKRMRKNEDACLSLLSL